MPVNYNPLDWYWAVGDNLPGTQVWASARNAYVVLADATYVAWLAAGNIATVIDTQVSLAVVFQQIADGIARSTRFTVSGGDITLPAPMARWSEVNSSTGKVFLPFTLSPVAAARSTPFYITNNSGIGGPVLTIYAFDQTTVIGTLDPQTASTPAETGFVFCTLTNDITGVGQWKFFHIPTSDPLNATNLVKGLTALAQGGTHADLSATGGTSKFLRQNSSGADITVVQPASTDLSDTTAPGTYAPTDLSGAALTLTTNVKYTKIGNLVYMYGLITYPVTADGSNNATSLPVAVPSGSYAIVPGMATSALGSIEIVAISSTSSSEFFNPATGARYTNVQLSAQTIRFMLIYPTT